jgi:hypothetical protein
MCVRLVGNRLGEPESRCGCFGPHLAINRYRLQFREESYVSVTDVVNIRAEE